MWKSLNSEASSIEELMADAESIAESIADSDERDTYKYMVDHEVDHEVELVSIRAEFEEPQRPRTPLRLKSNFFSNGDFNLF